MHLKLTNEENNKINKILSAELKLFYQKLPSERTERMSNE